eukprot:COSAG01_NODE_21602_length_894_cov_0.939623_1_plen_101_part_01
MPAAQEGHLAIVRLLLRRCRLDVNAQNSGGASAIFFAAKYGRVGVVRYLLRDGTATAGDADADDDDETEAPRVCSDAPPMLTSPWPPSQEHIWARSVRKPL